MKAIVCEKFGPPEVLTLKDIEQPTPKDNEVLIRSYASSINTVDIMYRNAKLPKALFLSARILFRPLIRLEVGIRKPKIKIPGTDFAGEIVAIGKDVTQWKEGDKVYGYSEKGGALGEYFCLPADYRKMTTMPSNMSYEEAGAVPGAASPALTGLRDFAELKQGQKILIVGASGGIGTYAVQLAKIYGTEVTGVCGSKNVDMVKEIGADYVIDYTKGDYTIESSEKYDIIFDAVAALTFNKSKKLLTPEGLYVSNNPVNSKRHLYQMMNKRFKQGATDESAENLSQIREWIEAGKLKSVYTVFPLEQATEAHRLYETGHASGRVVIGVN